MKRIIVCCLIVLMAACKKDNDPVVEDPDYSEQFVGDYWTNTVNGTNSTAQTWKITNLGKNLLGIDYTINYTFKEQGKEIKSTEVYKLVKVAITDSVTFKINELAEMTDDGVAKTRNVVADGVKIRDLAGAIKIGTTVKFTNADNSNPVTTDYLEFKKK